MALLCVVAQFKSHVQSLKYASKMEISDTKAAIVFSGDQRHFFAIGTSIVSFLDVNPRWTGDIIVYLDRCSESNKQVMDRLQSKYPEVGIYLRKFDFPSPSFSLRNSYSYTRFTPMVYSKFEIFRLLLEYDVVIYSDYDVVFLSNLEEFYSELPTFDIAMLDTADAIGKWVFLKEIKGYDLSKKMYGAGLIVLTRNIQKKFQAENLYQLARKHGWKLRQPEQIIIGFVIEDFNLKCIGLDPEVYAASPKRLASSSESKIAHSPGLSKFWHFQDSQWLESYRKFQQLTGFQEEDFPNNIQKRNRVFFMVVRLSNLLISNKERLRKFFPPVG